MTRKEIDAVTSAINGEYNNARQYRDAAAHAARAAVHSLAMLMGDRLAAANPRFDRKRFMADAMRVEDPSPEKLADAARLALDALSTPRRAKVADAHAALTEALRAASEKESSNGNHPGR